STPQATSPNVTKRALTKRVIRSSHRGPKQVGCPEFHAVSSRSAGKVHRWIGATFRPTQTNAGGWRVEAPPGQMPQHRGLTRALVSGKRERHAAKARAPSDGSLLDDLRAEPRRSRGRERRRGRAAPLHHPEPRDAA